MSPGRVVPPSTEGGPAARAAGPFPVRDRVRVRAGARDRVRRGLVPEPPAHHPRGMAGLVKWVGRLLALVGAAGIGMLVLRACEAGERPALGRWHREAPPSEFRARDAGDVRDLAGYLELEERVFAELGEALAAPGGDDAAPEISRYLPGGPNDPRGFPRDWNRTFELEPARPARGAVLLLHGLSDSPYSLRRVGEVLAEEGFAVLGLRLPGHGTLPGALARARGADWRAAARLGLRHAAARAESGALWVVGYSTGGTLAVDLACAGVEGGGPRPDRVVLFSPAIGVTGFAALAAWLEPVAALPGLERLAWETVEVEYDPFKYSSFPLAAGAEVHGLTAAVRARLRALTVEQRRAFPPVLVLQSLVDTTVRTPAIVDGLLAVVGTAEDELVLFDVNRAPHVRPFLAREPDELLARLRAPGRPWTLTVLATDGDGPGIAAHRHAPGEARAALEPLELQWPPDVFSLSHVALPFPPEDWHYGVRRSADRAEPHGFQVGAIEPRGERALLRVPLERFMRLRYNPFFPWVEQRLRALASGDPR